MTRSIEVSNSPSNPYRPRLTSRQVAAMMIGAVRPLDEEFDEFKAPEVILRQDRAGGFYVEALDVWESEATTDPVGPQTPYYSYRSRPVIRSPAAPVPPPPSSAWPPPAPNLPSQDYRWINPGAACAAFSFTQVAEEILWLCVFVRARYELPQGEVVAEYDLMTVRGCRAWSLDSARFDAHIEMAVVR